MKNKKNNCKGLRAKITRVLISRLDLNDGWLASHITSCPRCQKRLGNIARVNLAFCLLRSQPHKTNLFMKANTQTVNTLKHSLRKAPAADKLRKFRPAPNWIQRNAHIVSSVTNLAACIAVVVLLKIGVSSSIDHFNQEGSESFQNHYAKYLDEGPYNDIFTA